MEVTFETKAWLSKHNRAGMKELRTPEGASSLFYSDGDYSSDGDTLVGTATVTLTLHDDRLIVENKVAALRAEATNIRAEATAKCTRIEGQIQQLLCIEA